MIDFMLPLAFAVFALVSVVRKLGRVAPKVLDGRKPWACDACMSTWASLLGLILFVPVYFYLDASIAFLLVWAGGAAGLAMLLLAIAGVLASKAAFPDMDPKPGEDDDVG